MKKVSLLLGGILILTSAYFLYQTYSEPDDWTNQYEDAITTEFHIHADFLVMINDEPFDFTNEKYQSRREKILNPDVHLHDNQGDMIHVHKEGVTMNQFLQSIGFLITPACFVTDSSTEYCTDETHELMVTVNGEPILDISNYELRDNDRILVYYGVKNNPRLLEYQNAVTDEACIYSGTCPDRGIAPPEECGLTCEL